MNEPRLTALARSDLKRIWKDLARKGDEAVANRWTAEILLRCFDHARFPETGQLREEFAPGLRSFPVAPYVAFFRPEEDSIQVIRILDGRRNLDRLMKRKGAG
ncbi:type II toxin-antitoxin system RelE/ParE family toxin [Tundrisphaera sp. TA3]|uniref:type II toxin-antitoxin system RelE/ParE family toxin n=1 Tax=Tundrisphaera sp. TA3 TaxID=3435775 RepID=UPI003EB85C51